MTKTEALKLALEALEKKAGSWGIGLEALNNAAITAIEEVLAQPEQEPAATKTEKGIVLHVGWDDLLAGTKLYTAPPKREWIGLNWGDLPEEWVGDTKFLTGAKWATLLLEEKNA